jgi:nucleoporin NDC1
MGDIVLTHLIAASLTEDKYGVVQRDIPRVLEALVVFLEGVEGYQAEIVAKYKDAAADVGELELERAGEALGDVAGGAFPFSFQLPLQTRANFFFWNK